jgi:hypothetical protein
MNPHRENFYLDRAAELDDAVDTMRELADLMEEGGRFSSTWWHAIDTVQRAADWFWRRRYED